MKEMLDYYNTHPFALRNGKFDMIPNTMVLTDIMCAKGYTRGEATFQNGIYVGNRVEFYPAGRTGSVEGKTRGIHYFRGNWWSEKERKRSNSIIYKRVFRPILIKGKKTINKICGDEKARRIEMAVKNILK